MRVSGVFKFNSKIILLSTIILKSAITICYTTKPCQQVDVLCVCGWNGLFPCNPHFSIYCLFLNFVYCRKPFWRGGGRTSCVYHIILGPPPALLSQLSTLSGMIVCAHDLSCLQCGGWWLTTFSDVVLQQSVPLQIPPTTVADLACFI